MSDPAEQPQALLFDLEDDDALLFSRTDLERTKRYTAEQVRNLEWKRDAIVMLLASDWPVEHIATRLHVNTRTVRAIAARSAAEVAGTAKMFGRVCQGLAARWMGLARTKEQEASFLQLVTAAGIATDKAQLLDAMGQVADVVDTKEAPDRAEAMAALRAMMADQAPAERLKTDLHSDGKPSNNTAESALSVRDAPTDAPSLPSSPGDGREEPAGAQGGGGGQPGPGGGPGLTGQPETGLQPKGPCGQPTEQSTPLVDDAAPQKKAAP